MSDREASLAPKTSHCEFCGRIKNDDGFHFHNGSMGPIVVKECAEVDILKMQQRTLNSILVILNNKFGPRYGTFL